MKTKLRAAAMLAATSIGWPALAAASSPGPLSGHYEWRSMPQFGPRSAGPSHKRVWVPDRTRLADCDCTTMRSDPSECMKHMHEEDSSPHG